MNTSKEAVKMHLHAINEQDVEAYRKTMNFPFTYQNYNFVELTHRAMPMGLIWLYGLQLAGMDVGECSSVTI